MLKMKRSRATGGGAQLRKVLGNFDLPTIPALVTTAIEQVSSPDCDLREVADTVGRDPGLSARLLTVVNSAAYAPRNPIVGVRQAVTMFGKNHLESMLISLAASRAVSSSPPPGFDMPRFWRIASWRASAAASVSKRFDRIHSSENFSAALLEDIAVPLLIANQPRYGAVFADWRAGKGDLADLEHEAFGWTHATVAGWLFEEWGFPDSLCDAVTETCSGDPTSLQYPVVRAVSALGAPRDYPEVIEETANRLTRIFGLPHDQAIELLEEARLDGATLAQSLA
jgi:HD-like signal output (HDOD) protein